MERSDQNKPFGKIGALGASADLDEIKAIYQELLDSTEISPQSRGFRLEQLLNTVLKLEGLEPKASYRKTGEQMDGSFFWMGQTFLFEAKWEKNKISASAIYAFRGKVEGKFHTTSGIFIAMNGYHEDTEQALITGKVGNVLLFDGDDMHSIFTAEVTFLSVLKYKLRTAGDSGSLYARYSLLKDVKLAATSKEIKSKSPHVLSPESIVSDLLVFVEGREDIRTVDRILKSIVESFALSYRLIELQGSTNIFSIPSFISTYQGEKHLKGVIVFIDDEMEKDKFQSLADKVSEHLSKIAIPINHLFLYIDDNTRSAYQNIELVEVPVSVNTIRQKLISFLTDTTEEYYDPEEFVLSDTLPYLLEDLEWDESEQCVYIGDDYSHIPSRIVSLDELVYYLNEQLIQNQQADLPLEWLKETDSEDHSWDIREYIEEHYADKISALGWA